MRNDILGETPLTKENYRKLYKRAQPLLWGRVAGKTPRGLAARKALAAAGFETTPGKTRAPLLEGTESRLRKEEIRISLDHVEEKAIGDNWQKTLDADNLRFEMEMPNKERENSQQRHPDLRPGAPTPSNP